MTPNEFADQTEKFEKLPSSRTANREQTKQELLQMCRALWKIALAELKLLFNATLIFVKTNKATLGT